MSIDQNDRVPVWQIARNIGRTTKDTQALLAQLGFPVELDPMADQVYTSKRVLREAITRGAQQ